MQGCPWQSIVASVPFGAVLLLHHQRDHVQLLLMAVVRLLSCEYRGEVCERARWLRTGLDRENSALRSLRSCALRQHDVQLFQCAPFGTASSSTTQNLNAVSQPLAHCSDALTISLQLCNARGDPTHVRRLLVPQAHAVEHHISSLDGIRHGVHS